MLFVVYVLWVVQFILIVMAESSFLGVVSTDNMENGSMLRLANENPNIKITNVPLNKINYIQWSRAVRMYLGGKLLLGYIDGTVIEPEANDPRHAEWKAYNTMVMSWMLNSIEPDVSERLYQLDTAKELWDTLHELYAYKNNMARINEIKQLIANYRQGNKFAFSHYTK